MAEPNYNVGEFNYMNGENYQRRRPLGASGEVNNEDSMTVPGEAFTIKEIMERALAGLAPDGREAVFMDQENLDRIADFPIDITDLAATRKELIRIDKDLVAAIKEEKEAVIAEAVAKLAQEKVDKDAEEAAKLGNKID